MVRQIKRTTEEYLREALVQLIEERPVDRVSVRMLCERAGINRSTFYRHFDCVETLVEKMSVEMCSRLVEIVTNDGRNDNILLMRGSAVRIYNDWFDYVRGSEELFRAFLGVNGPRNFYDRLFQNGIDWYDGLITGGKRGAPQVIRLTHACHLHRRCAYDHARLQPGRGAKVQLGASCEATRGTDVRLLSVRNRAHPRLVTMPSSRQNDP